MALARLSIPLQKIVDHLDRALAGCCWEAYTTSVVFPEVTTCAGMTAHTVLLAQTKVGFLTGGRKKYFLALPEDEQMVQLEEAYARATVAITRARALCLIMGPLDMKGLLGAATVMGTLMYGAGHVWAGHALFLSS